MLYTIIPKVSRTRLKYDDLIKRILGIYIRGLVC